MSDQTTTNNDPGDVELLRPWFGVIRNARSQAMSNGLSIVTSIVLTDEHGNPIQWCYAEPVRLSPLSKRDQFELLMRTMSGDKQFSPPEGETTNGKRRYRKTTG